MLRKISLWLVVLLIGISATYGALDVAEAAAHVGETVTLRGTVTQVRKLPTGLLFFNFGGKYPNATFTAVVRAGATGWDDAMQYEGQEMEVSGLVELFKDRPQIVLKSPEDLRPAGEAGATVASTPVATGATTVSPTPSPSAEQTPRVKSPKVNDREPEENAISSSAPFQVPLSSAEIKSAGKSLSGVSPTEATVAIMLPAGFDPAKPQRVLVVFSTDDGGGAHVKALPRLGQIANAAGWVAIAANGPVLEKDLSPEWHATMILAGLRALGEKYPTAKTWTFYTGGNSGGAARASMMAGALLAADYEVKGCFMGGAAGERFSTGLAVFRPSKAKLKKVVVFLSVGTQDHLVSAQAADANARTIEGVGLRKIERDSYEGGHSLNSESLKKALEWFVAEG